MINNSHGKRMVQEYLIKKLKKLGSNEIQPKLEAGDNITIEGNVISASGGGTQVNAYKHNITITSGLREVTLSIINDSEEEMNFQQICQWLYDNNFKIVSGGINNYECSGYGMDSTTPTWIEFFDGCYSDNPTTQSNFQLEGSCLFHNITKNTYTKTTSPIASKQQNPITKDIVIPLFV